MDSIILFIVGGIVAIIGLFKACDWLISQKYKTKDDCENCRNTIFEIVNRDKELLARVDTKMDLILENMKITVGGE